jgi:hypothetical protein
MFCLHQNLNDICPTSRTVKIPLRVFTSSQISAAARVCVRDGVELLVTRFTGAAPLPLFIDLSSFDDKHAFRG